MSAQNPSRTWSMAWMLLFVVVIPFGLAYLLFDVNRFEIGVLLALFGLLLWLISQGAGWRPVQKDTVVIVKDSLDGITAHPKNSYLYIPIVHKLEAVLPTYPITFEFPIEAIDTHTPNLNKITKISVRATCQITNPEMFYRKSRTYIDRIKQMEDDEKLKRTEVALWRKLLEEVANVYLDDTVRDIVWNWKAKYLTRQEVIDDLDHKPEKDGKPNYDGDPYSLSRNRRALGNQVKFEVKHRLEKNQMGFRIDPLVFEQIGIDEDLVKRANADRPKEREKAAHEAAVLAEAIRVTGEAEAAVRAHSLAGLLDVLINKNHIPYSDPLIADLIRAALYKDGEVSWKRVIEKSENGDGKKAS
jgi:hypothetical protein